MADIYLVPRGMVYVITFQKSQVLATVYWESVKLMILSTEWV